MFWASMCPSSGDTTVFLRHLVLVILCGWLSGMQGGSTQDNKYQMLHKHTCFSWCWAISRPKHAEIDKHTKNKLCTKLVLFTRLLAHSVFLISNLLTIFHTSFVAKFMIILLTEFCILTFSGWLSSEGGKCTHLCPIVLHSKSEDYWNKVAYFLKVLADTVSEPRNSRLVLLWCYRLAFRIFPIWSMARAPSMCTDIFHVFSSVPLDQWWANFLKRGPKERKKTLGRPI